METPNEELTPKKAEKVEKPEYVDVLEEIAEPAGKKGRKKGRTQISKERRKKGQKHEHDIRPIPIRTTTL